MSNFSNKCCDPCNTPWQPPNGNGQSNAVFNVATPDNAFSATVNRNETVNFIGGDGITVTGSSTNGIKNILISGGDLDDGWILAAEAPDVGVPIVSGDIVRFLAGSDNITVTRTGTNIIIDTDLAAGAGLLISDDGLISVDLTTFPLVPGGGLAPVTVITPTGPVTGLGLSGPLFSVNGVPVVFGNDISIEGAGTATVGTAPGVNGPEVTITA